ncbi:unnamed protein product [Prorocentrum cordatum]|uniref:Uncharacterized protein n=1 Tax=Prorocentrum cordatum TaxID=2364126 RepID=A0ABN9VYN3_9DINO|nr:unnamed protein product [Polarella glacialis]
MPRPRLRGLRAVRLLLAAAAGRAGASDPCFSRRLRAQRFGHGFGVSAGGGESGPPPRLEADAFVAHVRYDGCAELDFYPRLKQHETRGGLCAVWLERQEAAPAACGPGQEERRLEHEVRVSLPAAAANCSSLLFAFPPGQRFEYYDLARPPAWPAPLLGGAGPRQPASPDLWRLDVFEALRRASAPCDAADARRGHAAPRGAGCAGAARGPA